MQLIETYTSAKGIPIWFQFSEGTYIQRKHKSLILTGTNVREMNRYITSNLLKKITGKTWGDLCS